MMMEEENCPVTDVDIVQNIDNNLIFSERDAPKEVLFDSGQGDASPRLEIDIDLSEHSISVHELEDSIEDVPADPPDIEESMPRRVSADSECDAFLDAVSVLSVDARLTVSTSGSITESLETSGSSLVNESPATSATSSFTDGLTSNTSDNNDNTSHNDLSRSEVEVDPTESASQVLIDFSDLPLATPSSEQQEVNGESSPIVTRNSYLEDDNESFISAGSQDNFAHNSEIAGLQMGSDIQIPPEPTESDVHIISEPTSQVCLIDLDEENQHEQFELQINDTPETPHLISECASCTYHNPLDVNACEVCGSWDLVIIQIEPFSTLLDTPLPSHISKQIPTQGKLQENMLTSNKIYPTLPPSASDLPTESTECEEGACSLPLPQSYRDCPYCTYRNSDDAEHCEVCNVQMGSFGSGSKYLHRLEEEEDYFSSAAVGRICSKCTFINGPNDDACSVCDNKLECQPVMKYPGSDEPVALSA